MILPSDGDAALAAELTDMGVVTTRAESNEELLKKALEELEDGDVLVTMSSGKFDDLPRRILADLQARD